LLYAIVNVEPEPLVGGEAEIPESVERVIGKALEKGPQNRYADAAELLEDLERAAEGEAVKGRLLRKGKRGRIIGAIAGAVIVLSALYFGFGNRGGRSPGEPDWQQTAAGMIAVLPFSYSGSAEHAHLGDGLMHLLGTTLDGTGDAHTVSSDVILRVVNQFDPEASHGNDIEVANTLGVNRYVRGDIVEAGGLLRISAGLHDRTLLSGDYVRASVAGDASDLFRLVDDLTEQLLVGQEPGPDQHFARLASMSSSLPALKAYLKGQQLDREWWATGNDSEEDQATKDALVKKTVEAYENAVDLDSTFSLAWYRLSRFMFGGESHEDSISMVAAAKAVETSDHLPPRERKLLNAWRAYIHGEVDEAEKLFKEILKIYPQDFQVLQDLCWVYLAYSHIYGLKYSAGLEFAERGLLYDPDNQELLANCGMSAIYERDWELFDRVDRETYWSYVNRPLAGLLRGDQKERRQIVESMRGEESKFLDTIVRNGEIYEPRLSEFEEIAALMISPEKGPEDRAYGHWRNAIWTAGRGRWQAAKIHLDSLAVLPRDENRHPVLWKGLLTALPYTPVAQSDLDEAHTQLKVWKPDTDKGRVVRLYTLGLLAFKMQSTELVLDYANKLESMPPILLVGSLPGDFAMGLHARVAMSQGLTEVALNNLLSAHRKIPFGPNFYSPTSLDWERYLQAELLKSLGRHEEALRWFHSLSNDLAMVYSSMPHLSLGETYERLGRLDEAVEHYEIFVDLWGDCDAELRPYLTQAEERLNDLRSH
jgi:tetratricopeptide (TPR) repeat protein